MSAPAAPQPAIPKPAAVPKPVEEAKPALQPRLSLLSKVKALVSSEVEIAERDVAPLLEELELALLESDVSQDTAQFLAQDLRARLTGKRVPKGRVGEEVRAEVSRALADVFAPPFDLAQKIREKRAMGEPLVVLFVGPNGTGKTTLVAKIAHQLKAQELKGVIAAADTFRKGALEQAQEHGRRTGVPVISRGYGADPTSVAFDAVQHAKANGLDVVLVDTAGRQETSTNLVREMEKMNRVLRPDLKVFVGEAIAGHALVEQVKKFHEAIRLDGIALTKLDCDAKGGGALSIAYETRLPLLYLGTGQEYGDLVPFDREWLVHRIAG
jgi:fused signal recognition particle receptor